MFLDIFVKYIVITVFITIVLLKCIVISGLDGNIAVLKCFECHVGIAILLQQKGVRPFFHGIRKNNVTDLWGKS